MLNKGAVEFAAMPGGLREKSQRFRVSDATISAWQLGNRKPAAQKRREIHEAGGPEPESWDELVPEIAAAPAREPEAPVAATPAAARSEADRLLATVRALQDAADDGAGLDLQARVRVAERLAAMVATLGRLTGDAVINERQILRSPAAREIENAIVEALAPWPDAMRAVGERLAALRDRD